MEWELKCCKGNAVLNCMVCAHVYMSACVYVFLFMRTSVEVMFSCCSSVAVFFVSWAGQWAWRIYLSLLSQYWGCSVYYGASSSNTGSGTATQEFVSVWQVLYQPWTSSRPLCFYLSNPLETNQLLREIMSKFKLYSRSSWNTFDCNCTERSQWQEDCNKNIILYVPFNRQCAQKYRWAFEEIYSCDKNET